MKKKEINIIEKAAALLDEEALIIKLSYSIGGCGINWLTHCAEKSRYELLKQTSINLYDLSEKNKRLKS